MHVRRQFLKHGDLSAKIESEEGDRPKKTENKRQMKKVPIEVISL